MIPYSVADCELLSGLVTGSTSTVATFNVPVSILQLYICSQSSAAVAGTVVLDVAGSQQNQFVSFAPAITSARKTIFFRTADQTNPFSMFGAVCRTITITVSSAGGINFSLWYRFNQ